MARFEFPQNPINGAITTNDETGVTYIYDLSSHTWSVYGTNATDSFATTVQLNAEQSQRISADNALDGRITTLESAPAPDPDSSAAVTYLIQTDKILRSSDPAIELVDSAGFYSNVTFQGTGGIAVSSDAQSIIIDASNLEVDVDLSDIEADIAALQEAVGGGLTDQDSIQNQLDLLSVQRGSVAKYKLEDTVLEIASRRGEFYTNANKASDVTIMSFASLDLDGNTTKPVNDGDIIELNFGNSILRYTARGSSIEALPVDYADGSHSFSSGQEMNVYIYPLNSTSASKDYVDAQDDLNKQYVDDVVAGLASSLSKDYVDAQDELNKQYVDTVVAGLVSSLNLEDSEPDIFYGDYPPTGTRTNGELWFDSMNLRLNVYSQGAWVNPDRNDGAALENRITLVESRIAQLEGN